MAKLTSLTQYGKTTIHDNSEMWIDDYNSEVVTMTNANPCVVTKTAHGLDNNCEIVFSTTGALPTNVVAGTTYFVINKTTDTFQLSATVGGLAIDSTAGTQSGVHTGVYFVSRKMSGAQVKALIGNHSYANTFYTRNSRNSKHNYSQFRNY